ncbi:expressed unknown protein [Seminavis robusta]|uniref:Uncharacterized protein n=1 Tax=Seminavis robusta TaxID=568900 RepID=A0A9N8HYT3_9STRA|nr:expressed unknown protein [Seminavis robusta]|eukprot:Sro2631_g333190.1 n/a (562) ;mRNA; r:8201-9886
MRKNNDLQIDPKKRGDDAQEPRRVTPSPQSEDGGHHTFLPGSPPSSASRGGDFAHHIPPKTPVALKGYQQLNLSPTNMIAEDQAYAKMNDDRILHDDEFYRNATPQEKAQIDRCVYFLYGRKFFWRHIDGSGQKLPVGRDVRVRLIKEMLQDPEYRRRLVQIMECTGDNDRTVDTVDRTRFYTFAASFLRFVANAEERKKEEGPYKSHGFLEVMTQLVLFLRYQTFGICYLLAACTAYGYQMQKDRTGEILPPATPDASQLARRTMDDLKLYNVVTLKGGGTVAETLAYLNGDKWEWPGSFTSVWFGDKRRLLDVMEGEALRDLEEYGVGLLDNFNIQQGFDSCERQSMEWWRDHTQGQGGKRIPPPPPGVWVLDGGKDAEGKFTCFPLPAESEAEMIDKMWTNSGQQGALPLGAGAPPLAHREHRTNIQPQAGDVDNFTSSLPPPPPPRQLPRPHTTERSGNRGLAHAMIVLYAYRKGEGKNSKTFFLVQNTWENLPLVVMTGEYLRACDAYVSFNTSKLGRSFCGKQTSLPVTSCSLPETASMALPVEQMLPHRLPRGS